MVKRRFQFFFVFFLVRTVSNNGAQDILKIFRFFQNFDFRRFSRSKICQKSKIQKIAIFDILGGSDRAGNGLNRSEIGFYIWEGV